MRSDEIVPGNEGHGTADLLNIQLMQYLKGRRAALAIETRGDKFAAVVRLTVRPYIHDGPSCNDFTLITGELFKSWGDRFRTVETETLTLRATLPEAMADLAAWKQG